ncbi:MAG: AAA family ATPase, partial [Deltaproteobacteria bacterium]|nr:AAA family ATPase [Deltaproteobacteria bacterium]
SGKSSIMQPLLLLKQTLEADYEPGPLLLNGPNVRFTSVDQLLSKGEKKTSVNSFSVEVATGGYSIYLLFEKVKGIRSNLITQQMDLVTGDERITFRPNMKKEEIFEVLPPLFKELFDKPEFHNLLGLDWKVGSYRGFLDISLTTLDKEGYVKNLTSLALHREVSGSLRGLIHLPGLRGNPERAYPTAEVTSFFPGTFEHYTASVIANWQEFKDPRLSQLSNWLEMLGLTWKVEAKYIDDTRIELRVGRSPKKTKAGARDMVSLADVGFGVSQVLPVLVALLEAKPGQLVYLEQPEIHLHPRAKKAMAQILVAAAKRGVRIVAETHSSLLLTGIQTLVAKGEIDPEMIKLHWFQRDPDDGMTTVTSRDMDKNGAFGDWPVDFDEVILEAEDEYLNAS